MALKLIVFAALGLASLSPSAYAASPADIAAAVAPEVVQVVSGGNWADGGKKGGYRAIVVVSAGDAKAQLFIEWLAAGTNGGPPSLVATVAVKEVNELKLPDATLSSEFEKSNEYTVFVEPNDPSKDSGQSYTIVATVPGKYSFSPGALPE